MATPYSTVYDSFMQKIDDYKLNEFYLADPTNFEIYLEGFLIPSIVEFDPICTQDLTDRDDGTDTFNITLTDENVVLLGFIMVQEWIRKQLNDTKQTKVQLGDKDFKRTSDANNLRANIQRMNRIREEISQKKVDYSIRNSFNLIESALGF